MTESALSGRTAIVTGAGSGIGRAIAIHLAETNAKVALVGRRLDPLCDVAATIMNRGGTAIPVEADVSNWSSVDHAARAIKEAHGPIDLLVNNAGVAHSQTFEDTSPDEIGRVLDTNLKGVLYWTKAVLTDVIGTKGDIVNVSSLAGLRTFPGWSVYSASKHGIVGFSGCLAQELADSGVRVLTVCPGATDTDIWDETLRYRGSAKRLLDPADVAEAVLRLLSMPRHVTFKDVLVLPAGEWL